MSTSKKVNKVSIIIVTIFLATCCAGLTGLLSYRIYSKYNKGKRITEQETAVKRKLRMIRKAQELYYQENDYYASNWNELNNFVQKGELYNIERNESISLLENGLETIKVSFDTVAGPFSVADSLFPSRKYPNFNINSLNLVPNSDLAFILRADTLDGISVFEVVDPMPVDPNIIEGREDTLKIGSLTKVTTAGNWEK